MATDRPRHEAHGCPFGVVRCRTKHVLHQSRSNGFQLRDECKACACRRCHADRRLAGTVGDHLCESSGSDRHRVRALGRTPAFSHTETCPLPVCRLQTDPTNPLEAVESYQEGANLLSQARWVARPSPVVARTFQLHSKPSSARRAAAWPTQTEPPPARGRRWRWRRWTTQGSRRCRARSTWHRPRLQK